MMLLRLICIYLISGIVSQALEAVSTPILYATARFLWRSGVLATAPMEVSDRRFCLRSNCRGQLAVSRLLTGIIKGRSTVCKPWTWMREPLIPASNVLHRSKYLSPLHEAYFVFNANMAHDVVTARYSLVGVAHNSSSVCAHSCYRDQI